MDAQADGCVCMSDGDAVFGQETWESFAAEAMQGNPAAVRLANQYTLGDPSRYDPDYYESVRDEYPKFSVSDLVYDGERFSLTAMGDGGVPVVYTFQYLKKFEVDGGAQAAYTHFTDYELVDDEDVTWEQIWESLLSSDSETKRVRAYCVYSEYVWREQGHDVYAQEALS